MVDTVPYREILEQIYSTLQGYALDGYPGFHCSAENQKRLEQWGLFPPNVGSGETLGQIRSDLGDCRRCSLSESRRNIVFGSGDAGARLLFVGEGPGSEEDLKGEPFVGAAGQLLTRIIGAMHLTRESVYICNIVKCRPPGNRNPQPEEIAACLPFLHRQIRSIQPDYICALGKFAAQTLLETDTPISRLRGRFFEYRGIPVLPTYHPAYLLRNPERKREVWEDMQQLMRRMGLKTS